MSPRIKLLSLMTLCLVGGFTELAALAREDKDVIIQVQGPPLYGTIIHDGLTEVIYRVDPRVQNTSTVQRRRIARIDYRGMRDGYWEAGMRDKAAGQYLIAAQRFQTLAGQEQEWARAYGTYQQGVCLELAEAYEDAAAAFGRLVAEHPDHVLLLDAYYRQGINLARLGDGAGANTIADALEALSKGERRLRQAAPRAEAVRTAVLALVDEDLRGATSQSRRVTLREGDAGVHWANFWADVLRTNEAWADAVRFYEGMLEYVDEPDQRARLRLGMGIAMANSGDAETALGELLAVDALPYGSPSERIEAQYWSGRLLWETASATLAGSPNEKRTAFAEHKQAMAREILTAVVNNNTTDTNYPSLAETYIAENLPSEDVEGEEGEESEEGEGQEGEAAADALEAAAP